jgi:hypothetical protein
VSCRRSWVRWFGRMHAMGSGPDDSCLIDWRAFHRSLDPYLNFSACMQYRDNTRMRYLDPRCNDICGCVESNSWKRKPFGRGFRPRERYGYRIDTSQPFARATARAAASSRTDSVRASLQTFRSLADDAYAILLATPFKSTLLLL